MKERNITEYKKVTLEELGVKNFEEAKQSCEDWALRVFKAMVLLQEKSGKCYFEFDEHKIFSDDRCGFMKLEIFLQRSILLRDAKKLIDLKNYEEWVNYIDEEYGPIDEDGDFENGGFGGYYPAYALQQLKEITTEKPLEECVKILNKENGGMYFPVQKVRDIVIKCSDKGKAFYDAVDEKIKKEAKKDKTEYSSVEEMVHKFGRYQVADMNLYAVFDGVKVYSYLLDFTNGEEKAVDDCYKLIYGKSKEEYQSALGI